MSKFHYARAHTLDEAVQLLNEPGLVSRPLAGGTDLLVYLRQQEPWFNRLVDISRLPDLQIIEQVDAEIQVGAGVTFTQAAESVLLNRVAPVLVEACQSVGSPQIRNRGTLGGNVANAAACADSLPALVCLEAIAHLRGPGGERQLPVSKLVTGPNRNEIKAGELLTHFSFAVPPAGARSAFTKLGRRNAQAISRLSMAAIGRLDAHNAIDFVRLTPGAATPRTVRFEDVEALLLGQLPTNELLSEAGQKVAQTMIDLSGRRWSTDYKEIAIQALAERTLRRVLVS